LSFIDRETGKYEKLIFQILRGTSDANISFSDLISLSQYFGLKCVSRVVTTFSGKKALRRNQIYRKKGIRQNHIKSNRSVTLFLNMDWEIKVDK